MTPDWINFVLFFAAIAASSVGFLSCAILFKYARGRPAGMRCVYQWGLIFFAGASLLAVDWAMGACAPLPIRPAHTDLQPLGMAPLMVVWMLVCVAGVALQRVLRVVHRPNTTVEGRSFLHRARAQANLDHHDTVATTTPV